MDAMTLAFSAGFLLLTSSLLAATLLRSKLRPLLRRAR